MMAMLEIDEVRNAVANLQIDSYQLNQKFEIIELKMNEILEIVGNPNVN